MATPRPSIASQKPRFGLTKKGYLGGPPLTQVNGKLLQSPNSAKSQKVSSPSSSSSSPSVAINGDHKMPYDPITAPPESSGDEAETLDGDRDSDEDYQRRQAADIHKTTFKQSPVFRGLNSRPTGPFIRAPRFKKSLEIVEISSSCGSKRGSDDDEPKAFGRAGRDLEPLRKKKKKLLAKYGSSNKSVKQNGSLSKPLISTSRTKPLAPSSPGKKPFRHADSLSPAKQDSSRRKQFKTIERSPEFEGLQDAAHDFKRGPKQDSPRRKQFKTIERSPEFEGLQDAAHDFKRVPKQDSPRRKQFKTIEQSPEFEGLQDAAHDFKRVPGHDLSPTSTPKKRFLEHSSPVSGSGEKKLRKSVDSPTNSSPPARWLLRRQSTKWHKPPSPSPLPEELPTRPVFKMPDFEDIDSPGDSLLDDAGTSEAPATIWDDLEIEETDSKAIPRCPMCHQEVDRELIEKYSTGGKMNIKQQTAFCRLHKRKSAVDAGKRKGYPTIDWETLGDRCSAHQAFLQNILEGTQESYYGNVMKEMVESGKNRTLLTNNDNLTPGYYGPRGLQVMTEFIMSTLSSVIRRRAVEDKLISARSYTGYVQMVLVPELAVRLIMEDMSATEERARTILEESAEIGELLHEEEGNSV